MNIKLIASGKVSLAVLIVHIVHKVHRAVFAY